MEETNQLEPKVNPFLDEEDDEILSEEELKKEVREKSLSDFPDKVRTRSVEREKARGSDRHKDKDKERDRERDREKEKKSRDKDRET